MASQKLCGRGVLDIDRPEQQPPGDDFSSPSNCGDGEDIDDNDSHSTQSIESFLDNEDDKIYDESKVANCKARWQQNPSDKEKGGNRFPTRSGASKPVRKGLMLPASLILAGDSILELLFDSHTHEAKLRDKGETTEVREAQFVVRKVSPSEKDGVIETSDINAPVSEIGGGKSVTSNNAFYWTGELNRLESLVAVLMEENEELASDVNALSGEKNSLAEENKKLREKLQAREEEEQALKDENERLHAQLLHVNENAPTLADKELLAIQSECSNGFSNTLAKVTSPTSVVKLAEPKGVSSPSSRPSIDWNFSSRAMSKNTVCLSRSCQREREALQCQLMSYMEEIRVLTDVSHSAKLFRAELSKKAKSLEHAWTSADVGLPEALEQSLTQPMNQLLKHCRSGCNSSGQNGLSSSLTSKTNRRRSLDNYSSDAKGSFLHNRRTDRLYASQEGRQNNVEELAAALKASERNSTGEESQFTSMGSLGGRQGGLLYPPGSVVVGDQIKAVANHGCGLDEDDDDLSVTSAQSAITRPSGMLFGRMFRGRRGSGGIAPSSTQSVC